jgi:subtilase family serine protease
MSSFCSRGIEVSLSSLLRFSALRVFLLSLLSFSLAVAQQIQPRPLIVSPIDESRVVTLRGNVHPLAQPMFDMGAAPPDLPMNRMMLVLKHDPMQDYVVRKLIDDQQDKNSPNYHKWLTPSEFGAQFGASDQDVQLITGWLQSHGFQINRVSNGRNVIEFSGVEAQVEQAFHPQIHQYVLPNGQQHWANASDPQIPAALAPAVEGLVSLHNFPRKPMLEILGKYNGRTGQLSRRNPQFTTNFQGTTVYAVGPADFGTIYNVQSLWNSGTDGTGQKIAIVAQTDINIQDVRDFRNMFGLPVNDPTITYNGPNPGIVGDESESDIDVQWAGAIAPKAAVNLVVSESTETAAGVDLSAIYIVDNNLAPVMSVSYGFCELGMGTAGNQFYNNLWQQAAAQGITVVVASGDNGAAGCDFFNGNYPQPAQYGLAVSGFASTPYNVAVGGTDFNDPFNPQTYWNPTNTSPTLESAKGYIPEVPWNDSCTNPVLSQVGFSSNAETRCNDPQLINDGLIWTVGGSGGVSNCTVNSQHLGSCSGGYAKPSWQVGTLNDGKRDLPDVSFFASNGFMGNFYIYCQADAYGGCTTYNFGAAGGTSFGAPIFAAVMALVNQQQQTPEGQGNPNYILYKLGSQQTASSCNSSAGPAST